MAKGNQKATKVKPIDMTTGFKHLYTIIDELISSSEEVLPLFSASLVLSKKILRMYERAFEAGKKYVKRK